MEKRNQRLTIFQKKNRKGWLKIVEAFVAVLLVASVALIVINRNQRDSNISETVYEVEISILREIQLNEALRASVLKATPPIEFDGTGEGQTNFPNDVEKKITERTPNYLECKGKICTPDDSCYLISAEADEIYAESVILTGTDSSGKYTAKQLKIFCWTK